MKDINYDGIIDEIVALFVKNGVSVVDGAKILDAVGEIIRHSPINPPHDLPPRPPFSSARAWLEYNHLLCQGVSGNS